MSADGRKLKKARNVALLLVCATLGLGVASPIVHSSPPCWARHGTCPTTTSTQAATTTVTTAAATTATSVPSYLFADDFDGAAGSPPDPGRWINLDGIAFGGMTVSKATNAYLDGNGHLVLRISREPWYGKSYAGASIGSYAYQTGWPPAVTLASWPVPFRYEVRFTLPNVAGAWVGPGWNQNVDRTTSQDIYELDPGESRSTFPTVYGANQHTWLNGSDIAAANASATGSDGRTNWHTVDLEATSTECRYYLDGVLIATHYGVSGRFGVQLQNEIADAGAWGSGGQQPATSDPGPWQMLIDYVHVTTLG